MKIRNFLIFYFLYYLLYITKLLLVFSNINPAACLLNRFNGTKVVCTFALTTLNNNSTISLFSMTSIGFFFLSFHFWTYR